MNDVFISYARPDRDVAHRLADLLEAQGLSVWWDRELAPGQKFATVIAEELERARAVVVLWSATSIKSNWVLDEAAEGQRRNVLVPASIDAGLLPPLGFRGLHAADLAAWATQAPGTAAATSDPELAEFLQAVAATARRRPTGQAPAPAPVRAAAPAPAPAASPAKNSKKAWAWAAALGIGAIALAMQQPSPVPAPPEPEPQRPSLGPTPQGQGTIQLQGLGVRANPGFDIPVQWRDYVLAYQGRLVWDGGPRASLQLQAVDTGTQRMVASGHYTAQRVQDAPGRIVFTTQVPLPQGDSRSTAPHSHGVGLVFEQQPGGGWLFRDNCMQPGRPDTCYR